MVPSNSNDMDLDPQQSTRPWPQYAPMASSDDNAPQTVPTTTTNTTTVTQRHQPLYPMEVSQDLFALIGGAPTVLIHKPSARPKPKPDDTQAAQWVWRGFTSSARNDDLVLYHWVKADEDPSDYHFAPFNQMIDVGEYTEVEYDLYLRDDDWTKAETAYLMDLCRQFDLRFVVVADRYEFPDKSRSMEDLKERYYSVQQKLLRGRHTAGPINDPGLQRDLAVYDYNKDREIERKSYLEVLYRRTRAQVQEEEALYIEARRLDQNEKRLTHERNALLRLLNAHETNLLLRQAGRKARRSGQPSNLAIGTGSAAHHLRLGGDVPAHLHLSSPLTGTIPPGSDDPGAAGLVDPAGLDSSTSFGDDFATPFQSKKRKFLKKHKSDTPGTPRGGGGPLGSSPGSLSPVRSLFPGTPTPSSGLAAGGGGGHTGYALEGREFADGDHPGSTGTGTGSSSSAAAAVATGSALVTRVASRDRQPPGAFIRSTRIAPVKISMSQKVLAYLDELNVPPRPVMATGPICAEFDRLQANILALLELKKHADKLEADVKQATARKAQLLGQDASATGH
ncbi:swr complex subunit [Dimargaris cristalligena]|nr:swr complex subunit [Dimargaris cristalligena]